MAFETLLYDAADRVGTITFNRPEALNATNDVFYRELAGLLRDIARDDSIGAVLMTGAGRGFCAGADVRAMDPAADLIAKRKRHRWILSDVLRPLVDIEKPVIAAVNGPAVGAGFNLALAADILIASDSAIFSQIFTRLGLVPDLGGLHLLTRVAGLNKAKEICFTARKIDAAEALSLGIANRVVPQAALMSEARALAVEIAKGPPVALAQIKMLLNKSSNATLEQMLEYESYAQTLSYAGAEHREGVAAFRERRQPDFTPRKG